MKFSSAILSTLLFLSAAALSETKFYPRQFRDFQAAMGGQLPYPAEKLIQRLNALDPGAQAFAEIIPHGRSLERTLTDFKSPRTVLNWRSGSTATPYLLYLGFTPKAEQIEVMSWNWNTRQFDFLIVGNYAAGKVPRIQNVNRATCTSCHQGGGPIFSRAPWSETTAVPFIRVNVTRQAEDGLSHWLMSSGRSSGVLTDAPTFDVQVQTTTQFVRQQKVCRDACGEDLECRKGILYAALLGTTQRADRKDMPADLIESMRQAMTLRWPTDRFSLPDPRLENRIVDFNHPLEFTKEQDPIRPRKIIFRLSPEDGIGKLVSKYSQCWSFDAAQIAEIRGMGPSRIAAALKTEQIQLLIKKWLPNETSIVSALSSAVANPESIQSGASDISKMVSSEVFEEPSKSQLNTVVLFQAYCSSCHSGPSKIPPILPLSDLSELSHYKGVAQRTAKDLLESLLMPPKDAPQPTASERTQMISGLKN